MNILKSILRGLGILTGLKVKFDIGQLENSDDFNTSQLPLLLVTIEAIDWEMDAYRRFANDVEVTIKVCHKDIDKLLDTVAIVDNKLFEKVIEDGDFKTDRVQLIKTGKVETEGIVKYCELIFVISRIWLSRTDVVKYTNKKITQKIK